MATLILSNAGAAIGGRFGASVGSVLGREIDKGLRGRGKASGISDLRVQTSHYGSDIPAVYGRMRVAGPVIWATDLVQTAVVSKSGAKHSYSVSFAIAVSSRVLRSIGRIWADGRLIRGKSGDHKISFELRFHNGEESEQEADELISSIEGRERTPAYHGLALLVFEDFDLSTFGNRLPQISVEVDAGDGEFAPTDIYRETLSLLRLSQKQPERLTGYALQGGDNGAALAPLVAAVGTRFNYNGKDWYVAGETRNHRLSSEEIIVGDQETTLFEAGREPPDKVSLHYFDEALDFATGEKSATTSRVLASSSEIIGFPGVLTSDHAKGLVQDRLASRWTERNKISVNLPRCRSDIEVGDRVELPSQEAAALFVTEKIITDKGVRLVLTERAPRCQALPSEPGSMLRQADALPTPIAVAIVELPHVASADGSGTVGIAAVGGSNPFRALSLRISVAGTVQEVPSAKMKGVFGRLLSPLLQAPGEAIDALNTCLVELQEDVWLTSAVKDAIFAGANLAWIGDEVVQFAKVEPVAPRVYRLSSFLRDRSSTSTRRQHDQGSPFILMESERLSLISIPAGALGCSVDVEAFAPDGSTCRASTIYQGLALRPWSPIRPIWSLTEEGLQISWHRRSRLGSLWLNGVDMPLGETSERYDVRFLVDDKLVSERVVMVPEIAVAKAELSALPPGRWAIEISQVGDFSKSPAVKLQIT